MRDKLRQRAQPRLEPGEHIQAVFLAQTGPSPWFAGPIGALIFAFIAKHKIVVVTDRAIIMLQAGTFSPNTPKALLARLPRGPIGPPVGRVWGKLNLGGERHWVHRRFFEDITSANLAGGGHVPA